MKSINELVGKKPWIGWLIFATTLIVVFLLGLLASSIMERRAEAIFAYTPIVGFESWEPRSEIWGQNFPKEYDTWRNTADTSFKTKHGGNALVDALEAYPQFVILWAGYAFARDYNQPRGHFYAVTDVYNTLRVGSPMDGKQSFQPNTCWTCKSSDVPRVMAEIGIEEFYSGTWETRGTEIVNSIGCADCHDANTMNLTITRPALIEAFERRGKDISKASHQEMRSLVCAQCHVEYYFNKNNPNQVSYLTFPWDKGLSVEDMEDYFDNINFTDWVHTLSKAPMLKAQHPDYELYLTGIHAQRGLSCADCHMPYISEGGLKYTSHHIMSPLKNVNATCQVCHREDTQKLIESVYERQDKIYESRTILEKLLVKLHIEAKFAWDKGANENEMQEILKLIRKAQWRWDFVAASHGGSFHAPIESARILSNGIYMAQEARLSLSKLLASKGHYNDVPMPDVSTKAKAQEYIGLDMSTFKAEKKEFLEKEVPKWLNAAKERESKYPIRSFKN